MTRVPVQISIVPVAATLTAVESHWTLKQIDLLPPPGFLSLSINTGRPNSANTSVCNNGLPPIGSDQENTDGAVKEAVFFFTETMCEDLFEAVMQSHTEKSKK